MARKKPTKLVTKPSGHLDIKEVRPRATALKLVEAYIDGKDNSKIIAAADPVTLDLAKTHARIAITQIKAHTKAFLADRSYWDRMPKSYHAMVGRYIKSKGTK